MTADRPLRFCYSATFSRAEELVPLARAGDEHGWSTLTVSDHLINPVATRSTYPYTKDGTRRWEMGTHWPDPWVTIGHLAAVTTRLRFLTTVYILPPARPCTSPSRWALRPCCRATASTSGSAWGGWRRSST